jgi:hypothetical protein
MLHLPPPSKFSISALDELIDAFTEGLWEMRDLLRTL